MKKLLFLPCCLLSFSVFGQLDLIVNVNAVSGVAPFYAFFDATATTGLTGTNDLVNADFDWNFDAANTDPNGNWETTRGMVAGHVFETPGTYTVSCTVTAPDGSTDTESLSITVSAFSGVTYYVSNAGNDTNDGLTPSTAWQTANYALSQLSPNEQILFNRGETFANVDYNLQNLSGGKMIIGAYGTGNKPVLNGSLDQNMIELDFINDMVITDLHLIASSGGAGAANFSIEDSEDILLLDLELEGSTSLAVYFDDCDKMATFDSNFHDFGVLAVYSGDGSRFSWVGNTIDDLLGTPQPEHGLRIQGGEKQFIANNIFTDLINTKSSMQIRGDGQRHVMIYQNKMDRIMGINPTNSSTVQAISDVTVEGNYIGQNPDYSGTTWENSINGINIEATNIAVRNNVIDGYRNAVNVAHDYNGVISGWVDVYHNTVNWRSISVQSGTSGFITRVRDVSNVNVINNFITGPTPGNVSEVSYGGSNSGIVVNNNVIATPADYLTFPLPGSAADLNDIINYQIMPTSAAVHAGMDNLPVFYDANGDSRNVGLPDVGAFENQTILAAELLYFKARVNSTKEVNLNWSSTAGTNHHFLIERSKNTVEWEILNTVEAMANASSPLDYTYLDNSPFNRVTYYRIKQIDQDGNVLISPIRVINMPDDKFQVFPVPASDQLNVICPQTNQNCHFFILDNNGKVVLKESRVGSTVHSIDISLLPEGTYIIQIITGKTVRVGRFVKLLY